MCYIGCYRDNSKRDMEKMVAGSYNVDTCRVACSRLEYTYFSVQYGSQCFCGNDYSTEKVYERLDDSKCKRSGFPAGQGGAWANSVYKTMCNDACTAFDGISHFDGKTCCKASCGKFCGAGNCNQGPGGPYACCGSAIPDTAVCADGSSAPCTLAEPQGAKLCEHDNLTGTCCEVGPGEFSMPSKRCPIPNDRLSSVKITEGCRVTLQQHYDNHNDGGQKWDLEGPGYFNYRKDFRNDDVSSFIVECGDRPGANKYMHKTKSCVHGHNIVKHQKKTVLECKRICDADDKCVAFEYGVNYGGKGGYKPGDCQPQSKAESEDCDGAYHNLDLYIKA